MISAASPRLTTTRRQPRQPDPDLQALDRRIAALERAGNDGGQGRQVARLRLALDHLVRDQGAGGAQWQTNAANLLLSIERAEAAS